VVTFEGSRKNNIVWDLHGASVFVDDSAPPERRFSAVGFCRRYRNVFLIHSKNGIRWDDSASLSPVAERNNEGIFNVVQDPLTGLYHGFSMARIGEGTWQESLGYRVAEDDPWQKRLCLRTTAPTLAGPWAEAVPTIVPGPEDDAAGRRRYGKPYDIAAEVWLTAHVCSPSS